MSCSVNSIHLVMLRRKLQAGFIFSRPGQPDFVQDQADCCIHCMSSDAGDFHFINLVLPEAGFIKEIIMSKSVIADSVVESG